MENHHRKLIWHTLRSLGTNGSHNHTETCKTLIGFVPWYSLNPHTKIDEMIIDAVIAIAANTIKACQVFHEKYQSSYVDLQTNNLPTWQFFVAAWASRERLDKYLEKD